MKKISVLTILSFFVMSAFAEDLSGLWVWKDNNDNHTFSIILTKSKNSYFGKYTAVDMGGLKIDSAIDSDNKFITQLDGAPFYYVANFSEENGKAKISLSNDELIWQIVEEPKGEHYAPKKAVLVKYKKP